MSEPTGPSAPEGGAAPRSGHTRSNRGHRGGNRSRGRGPRPSTSRAETSAANTNPTAPTPAAAASEVQTEQPSGGRSSNRRRQRRGGDSVTANRNERARGPGASGRGGRAQRGMPIRGAGGHAFGGHLSGATRSNASNLSLQADAPEFRPGLPVQARDAQSVVSDGVSDIAFKPLARIDSSLRSTAPDVATRTHEDIANGLYECSICTSELRPTSKVWSCKTCWTVFHLGCIKKWSANEGSAMPGQNVVDEDYPVARQWRCPGCNLPTESVPSMYTCWCEKEVEPRPVSGVPPHSCGQTCSKPRALPKQCPHPCELTCHAGPCPPCTHMGPVQSCFCGKEASGRRCIETNYEDGWSCGQSCGDIMPCGEHTCPQPCHEGLCGACEVRVDSRCFCGKIEKSMLCTDRLLPKSSKLPGVEGEGNRKIEEWIGVFDCEEMCGRSFDCTKHICEKACHPQDADPAHCPRSPDVVTHCPCGKTALTQFPDVQRLSCEDPIPTCEKTCANKLSCGHTCQRDCHLENCPPCSQIVKAACRCGRMINETKCHQKTAEIPICSRTCKALLNCGRHECGELCCPGEKKATERLTQKKRLRRLDALPPTLDNNFEAEHICTRVCGRSLKCGNHQCPELCHKGPCKACREAVFEEISCHCGRTTLQPPLPCGTSAPPCRYPCERPKSCGHPAVVHNCHADQEPCPSCPYLMEKVCLCKRKTLKNQPCFRTEVVCGEICGKRLRCGTHFCRKPCHRDGECEDATSRCQQPCGDPKKACGHPCEDRCHSPAACKEDKPCESRLIITCDCQHLKTETRCLASRTSDGNKNKSLKCDDECARLERNRQLAFALNVDPAHQDNHVPYTAQTLQLYQEDLQWSQAQERELRLFAADDSEKRLRCKPMPRTKRAFLHALADDFGFDSESVDPEPHRHVFIFKTPRFVKAPMKTLAECVRIRGEPTGMATPTARTQIQQTKLTTDNAPFNGYILSAPRFALTLEELRSESASAIAQAPTLSFDIEFLPSEEIVFKARPSNSNTTITPPALENTLRNLRPAFSGEIVGKKLAGSVALCALDRSLNILRRETTDASASSGWNRVAARAASSKTSQAPGVAAVGQKSSFTVLSKRKETSKTKGTTMEEVVDDWEEEMKKEEEKETSLNTDGAPSNKRSSSDNDADAGDHVIASAVTLGSIENASDAGQPITPSVTAS